MEQNDGASKTDSGRLNLVVDPDLAEFAKSQQGGASMLVRALLRMAKDGKIVVEYPLNLDAKAGVEKGERNA